MTNPNEEAFGRSAAADESSIIDNGADGLTKREYFASKVLHKFTDDYEPDEAGAAAVRYADGLINGLNNQQPINLQPLWDLAVKFKEIYPNLTVGGDLSTALRRLTSPIK